MSRVKVFVEGNSSLKGALIQFIGKAVPAARGSIRIQLGKNRDETVKEFLRTLVDGPSEDLLLLVDSDTADDGTLENKLKQTQTWRNHASAKIRVDGIHWMVQVMESWFVADGGALREYYKKDFRKSALPNRTNVEEISKKDVFSSLKRASNGKYEKTAHAPRILECLSPAIVRTRAPRCDRFLLDVADKIK